MWFVGDIHGEYEKYHSLILDMNSSIQLGDVGIGFPEPVEDYYTTSCGGVSYPPQEEPQHRFICGNHDDHKIAIKSKNYLGRFGYLEKEDIFFIGGGYSIDRMYRQEGVTWWEYEELDELEVGACYNLYKETHPRIVCSHEAPSIAKYWSLFYSKRKNKRKPSRRERLLNSLYEYQQPEYWIHGHYHQFYTLKEGKTTFIGLDELIDGKEENCVYEIKTG